MCAVLVRDVLYLLKMFFFSFSAALREEERTPVPKISENTSEHRADCVQSVYNCVSCEPCQPSMLGSHAPFPVTLLYTRESQLILYIFNHFTLQFNSLENLSCLSYWVCRNKNLRPTRFLHLKTSFSNTLCIRRCFSQGFHNNKHRFERLDFLFITFLSSKNNIWKQEWKL